MKKKIITFSVPIDLADDFLKKVLPIYEKYKQPHEKAWLQKDIAYLKDHFSNTSTKVIADHLGKNLDAVESKAFKLKLKKSNRFWPVEDEIFVSKNWEVLSPQEIGDKLGRTKWGVINKYRELTGKRKSKNKNPLIGS